MKYKCKKCGREIGEYDHTYENDLCYACQKELRFHTQAEALQSNEETETYDESDIVCPWCGYHIQDDEGTFVSESDGEYECDECGKVFKFQADVTVTYSTQRVTD